MPTYTPVPVVLCRKCGSRMDPVLLEMGDDRHPSCAVTSPVRVTRRKAPVVTIPTGRQLRDEGMAQVWEATNEPWKQRARRAILALCDRGIPFTAEDVRQLAGDPDHVNAMGAAMGAAARAGLIYSEGYITPSRASRHANRLPLWHKAT